MMVGQRGSLLSPANACWWVRIWRFGAIAGLSMLPRAVVLVVAVASIVIAVVRVRGVLALCFDGVVKCCVTVVTGHVANSVGASSC